LSRVYLGVHWSFDAFALNENGEPDLSKNVGGVPLGMAIANDIAVHGLKASGAVGPATT
jgi:vanadium chloroperoxidase